MLMEYWFSLLMLVAIMFMAYFATKFLGTKYMSLNASKNIKIIDRVAIDKDKTILIVKIGDKYQCLVVTPHGATPLDIELNITEDNLDKPINNYNFQNILLEKFKKQGGKDIEEDDQSKR